MAKDDYDKLKKDLQASIRDMLAGLAEVNYAPLYTVQPPSTVIEDAAEAAARVFVAFERGYQMDLVDPCDERED